MADANSQGNGSGAGDGNGAGAGTPPAGTGTPPAPAASDVDLSKLPADQLAKALENPELWKLPRIQELVTGNQQLKKLQEEQQKSREAQLASDKKFEELAGEKTTQVETLTSQLQTERTNNALVIALSQEQAVDVDAAVKLIDRSKITIDDNGQVQGVSDAVAALKTDKAYLFTAGGQTPPRVGAPSNQGAGQQPPAAGVAKFKRSQLQGPDGQQFYKDNKAAIDEAYRKGEIEDDTIGR